MTDQLSLTRFEISTSPTSIDRLHILIIMLVWVGMAILANPIGDFPLNDDWVYGQAVKSVVESGYYHFPSPSSANVGPQVYWGALFCLPFGFSYTALRISSLVAGFAGVATLYFLIRLFCNYSKVALFGALVLAVNPLYFSLANSFMTDVPFLAIVLASLFFLVRGLEYGANRDIIIGILIAFVAVLIRQLGIVLLLGFAIAYPFKSGVNLRNLVKGIVPGIVGVLIHLTYQYWLIHTGRSPVLMVHSDVHHLFSFSGRGWYMRQVALNTIPYLGLFILPFVLLILHSRILEFRVKKISKFDVSFLAVVLLLIGVIWWKGAALPSIPNVLSKWGVGPLTLRDTYLLGLNEPATPKIVSTGWEIMNFLALGAGAIILFFLGSMAIRAMTGFRDPDARENFSASRLLIVTASAYFVILVFISGSLPIFDRYFILFIPIIIVLLSRLVPPKALSRRRVLIMPAMAVILYAYFSVASTHDYLLWNHVRWNALNALMADGKIGPRDIDGGYEFNGSLLYDAAYKYEKSKSWWWVDNDAYLIASGPVPGYSELTRYSFRRWLLFSESNILVLRKN